MINTTKSHYRFRVKPNRPSDLIKKILPKTPAIVFPISPKEYLLKMYPVKLAPIMPMKILIKEIKVSVTLLIFNVHNPFYLFCHPIIFFV